MNSKEKYALVTGASSGIGCALARLLAKDGYNLVIIGRNHDILEEKAEEFRGYGIQVIALVKDLFDSEQAFSVYSDLSQRNISPEILINDAGQGLYGRFHETEIQREKDMVNLNITSVLILTKLFLQDRVPQNSGKILNLASIASKAPGPWQSVYHGTKAFILSWSEAIREELKDTGISVTALLPGPTDTDFFNKAEMTRSKIMEDKESFSTAEEVAEDGYKALMNGDDKIISGLKNKLTVAMSTISSDSLAAYRMNEMQKPIDEQ